MNSPHVHSIDSVDNLIQARNLCAWYGEKPSLVDMNFRIVSNEIFALIGPSGCGKSTLLRCLNRMNDDIEGFRIAGEIFYKDQPIYSKKIDVNDLRKHIGMVFQKPNPFPKSIEANILWGLKIHGLPANIESVEQALRRAYLWDEVKDKLKSPALALSGGQQQRLCIARALALNPRVLLMDEPCSALDPIATQKIEELLVGLKESTTVVIVTHNLGQAKRIANETAFLEQGRIIEVGPTSQIFSNPTHPRTQGYVEGRFG